MAAAGAVVPQADVFGGHLLENHPPLFHVDARSSCEKKVIRLARQTPLSCAEIIKSIEMDIRRLKDGYDVLDKLYDGNDLNCDNFAQAVREYRCSREVITAVANLYLRKQIMLDTY